MRYLLLLALGLGAATLVGCEPERALDPGKEVVQLKAEKDGLRAHGDRLAKALKDLEWDRNGYRKRTDEYRLEVEQLNLKVGALTRAVLEGKNKEAGSRKRVEELEAALVRAVQVAAAPPAPKQDAVRTATQVDAQKKQQLTEIRKLQSRIATLQSQIARGRSKVSSLVRTTVDVRMAAPPGGVVVPPGGSYGSRYGKYYHGGADGLVLRRIRISRGSHKEGRRIVQDYSYRYVSCGPAIRRGDYRTSREKNAAIADAKREVVPLYEEAKKLETELVALRKLGR